MGTMRGVLYVAVLTIASSYRRSIEVPVEYPDEVPDTVQWWLGGPVQWRMRTYALDHDIHVHHIGSEESPADISADFASENTRKHYGDVLRSEHEVHIPDTTPSTLSRAFRREDLTPRYDIARNFVLWRPDDAAYQTRSRPDEVP